VKGKESILLSFIKIQAIVEGGERDLRGWKRVHRLERGVSVDRVRDNSVWGITHRIVQTPLLKKVRWGTGLTTFGQK